jgi:hypothetical protein
MTTLQFPQVERQYPLTLHLVLTPESIDQSATSVAVGKLPSGAQLQSAITDVITAFDGTTAALALKDGAGNTLATVDPTSTGRTVTNAASLKAYPTGENVTLDYDSGFAPTTGLIYMTATYTIAGRSQEVTV